VTIQESEYGGNSACFVPLNERPAAGDFWHAESTRRWSYNREAESVGEP